MKPTNPQTRIIVIDESHAGQRIDNFMFTHLKGVPKSRIYRSLRQGEVRVNKRRVKPEYRLQLQDAVRIPPLRVAESQAPSKPSFWQMQQLEQCILYETEALLIINKPSGIATHGGSGIAFGVIESLRYLRPREKFLELVHRLDRETSGCLMIAKKRAMLTALQELSKQNLIEKTYLTLVKGNWKAGKTVDLPLQKNHLQSGERVVRVSAEGKSAVTVFHPLQRYAHATLVKATLKTGRTHQIRVHATHSGHPIAGDEKYGDKEFNKASKKTGLNRLFLHAASLSFELPGTGERIAICACLDTILLECLKRQDM